MANFAVFHLKDQIDENLKTALQLDLLGMAPGLRVQVRCQLLIYFTVHFEIPLRSKIHMYVLWIVINNYSTSVRWIWDGELIGYNHLKSNKREWNNCFIKMPTKYWEFFPTLFVKTTYYQLVFEFEQTRTVTMFAEDGMMAFITVEPR